MLVGSWDPNTTKTTLQHCHISLTRNGRNRDPRVVQNDRIWLSSGFPEKDPSLNHWVCLCCIDLGLPLQGDCKQHQHISKYRTGIFFVGVRAAQKIRDDIKQNQNNTCFHARCLGTIENTILCLSSFKPYCLKLALCFVWGPQSVWLDWGDVSSRKSGSGSEWSLRQES